MKGFLKELQDSNAKGAVQVVKSLSGSVKQPELDGFADKVIFSVQGKGKLLWAEVYEAFGNMPTQSDTQMKVMLYIDGKLQANVRKNYNSAPTISLKLAPPERFIGIGNYSYLPTMVYYINASSYADIFSCSEAERQLRDDSRACDCYFPIEAYIPFEESVEIRVSHTFEKDSGTSASFNFGVGYLLDED